MFNERQGMQRHNDEDEGISMSWIDGLKEGDFVAYYRSGMHSSVMRGVVVGFTKQLIRVKVGEQVMSFIKDTQYQKGYSDSWTPPRIAEWTEKIELEWKMQNARSSIKNKTSIIDDLIYENDRDLESLRDVNAKLNEALEILRRS